MTSMHILLTCAGRRNYLVQYFKEALNGKGLVCAADSSKDAPALYEADLAFTVPKVSDAKYIEVLFSLCKENNIKAIVPLNDLELPVLSQNKEKFKDAGIEAIVSTPKVIDICFDKWETARFAQNIGIGSPRTYGDLESALQGIQKREIVFPLVVKPRWGSASICVEYVEDEEELRMVYALTQKKLKRTFLSGTGRGKSESLLIIQEYLKGQEFGLDIVNDLKGENAAVFVKRKLAMRAGETDKAMTVSNHELEDAGRKIGEALGHVGNLDCDIFQNEKGVFLLEMNPRFGGGYPFSHIAGANVPAAIVNWLENKRASEKHLTLEPGVISAKCDRLVICRSWQNKESLS